LPESSAPFSEFAGASDAGVGLAVLGCRFESAVVEPGAGPEPRAGAEVELDRPADDGALAGAGGLAG
jgi:hypothetical protein